MLRTDVSAVVSALRVGQVCQIGMRGELSAIDKQPAVFPVVITPSGLVGDEQADLRHHGGVEKAVHHYPAEHYSVWRELLPSVNASLFCAGGFGENICTSGMTEEQVCIGDIFRLGDVLLQVSQARQPCWKLNLRFGVAGMSRLVQQYGYTGWYYRVLKPGCVSGESELQLVERLHPEWSLKRLINYIFTDTLNYGALKEIAGLEVLAASWRQVAEQRLLSGRVESWERRLQTPLGDVLSTKN